ncbi:hypothetical protein L0Y69_02205 [bacterium]|nr:hypothetical protein [bacterium]
MFPISLRIAIFASAELLSGCSILTADFISRQDLTLPSQDVKDTNHMSQARLFAPDRPCARKELVVLVPTPGSDHTEPHRGMIPFLLEQCYFALHIEWAANSYEFKTLRAAKTEEDFLIKLEKQSRVILHAIQDIKEWINMVEKEAKPPFEKMHIIGFSMGTILAIPVGAQYRKIDKVIVFGGGGRLDQVFAWSEEEDIERLRERVLARFRWERVDFARKIEPIVCIIDPIYPATKLQSCNVLFFEASLDGFLPQQSREALFEALGKPRRHTFHLATHKMMFLPMFIPGLAYPQKKIIEFLETDTCARRN